MFNQLGVIGCGLMGGSFALACKRAGLVRRVIGYSKSPQTTEKARKLGVIDTDLIWGFARSATSGGDGEYFEVERLASPFPITITDGGE